MARLWRCEAPDCGAKNPPEHDVCDRCGRARPERAAKSSESSVRFCPADGGPLDAQGYCTIGHGFTAGASCPFVCPLCRHPLTWEGKCFACYGCTTGRREDWTIPGDRYDLQDGHWRMTEKGPTRVCTREQNDQALKIMRAVQAKTMTVDAGHAALRELFGEPEPPTAKVAP